MEFNKSFMIMMKLCTKGTQLQNEIYVKQGNVTAMHLQLSERQNITTCKN